MSRLVTEIVVPANLAPNAKQIFADELYEAHCRIFDGVDKKPFVARVIDSQAQHHWIQVHRNREGQLVGYFAVHVFEKTLDGRDVAIFTAQAGMMRKYRGANMISFGIDRILRYMSAHPGRALYYFGALVHPSSYWQIARFADRVWPNPQHRTPASLAGLMIELGRAFGWEMIDEATPLVRKAGWVTKDGVKDKNHWKNHESPDVQFFLRENPGYVEGLGLLTLVPLTPGGVVRAACRFAAHKTKRHAQAALASVQRKLLGSSPFAA